MKAKLRRAAMYLVAVAALIYLADSLSLRFRIPRREPLGSVTVERYYALHKSKQKTTFMFAEPEPQTCVRALFPHLGYPPCWYLRRRTEQRIDYE
jgi:hypothetical protein